jgi:hypothetical protein
MTAYSAIGSSSDLPESAVAGLRIIVPTIRDIARLVPELAALCALALAAETLET